MRKVVIITILFFLVISGYSQRFSMGPKIGVNMSSLTHYSESFNTDSIQNGQLITSTLGLITDIAFTDNLSLQTEFLYSQKGHRLNYNFDTIDFSVDGYYKYRLDYFEIPVLLRVSFGGGDVKGYLNAGPYWSYWMGGKTKIRYEMPDGAEDFEFSESLDFETDWISDVNEPNRVDVGLIIGGGFAYNTGPGNLLIDFRYGIGFKDMTNWIDSSQIPEGYNNSRSRVFTISFGYLFLF